MNDRKIPVILLVVILLVSSFPTIVMAQGAPRDVFLDQDTRKIASITVDGQSYEIYRHNNLIPYASGIDIYTGGNRVTSSSTARKVLTALAQRRAVEELGPDDVRTLRTTKRNVSVAAANVSASAEAINETLVRIDQLKTVRVDNSTAYNASVEAAPELEEFNETARELYPELQSFEKDSNAYTTNATALIELLQKRENGTSVDSQQLYERYSATLTAQNALSDHLDFNGVNEGLSEIAMQSETIANNVSTVPEHGEELAKRFSTIQNRSAAAANQTDALELPGFEFEETQDTAESLESEWIDQWQSRRNAAMDVYRTIGGLAVFIIVVIGYVKWRRR